MGCWRQNLNGRNPVKGSCDLPKMELIEIRMANLDADAAFMAPAFGASLSN
jgi:hypothetical protein